MSATISGDTSIRQFTSGIRRSAAARFIRVGRDRAWRAAGRVVLCCLVCAASVMCATSARAGGHNGNDGGGHNDHDDKVMRTVVNEYDFPFADYNPCIGSVVAGLGHFHSVFIEHRPTGKILSDTTLRIHQHGKGANTGEGGPGHPAIALPDTAVYKFQYWTEDRFRSSTTNFTIRMEMYEHIIHEGNLPPGLKKADYFTRSSYRFSSTSPKPFRNRDKVEERCK